MPNYRVRAKSGVQREVDAPNAEAALEEAKRRYPQENWASVRSPYRYDPVWLPIRSRWNEEEGRVENI